MDGHLGPFYREGHIKKWPQIRKGANVIECGSGNEGGVDLGVGAAADSGAANIVAIDRVGASGPG